MTRILSKKEVEEWNQKYNKNVLTVMITLNKHKIKVIENGYFEYDVSETEITEYLKKQKKLPLGIFFYLEVCYNQFVEKMSPQLSWQSN